MIKQLRVLSSPFLLTLLIASLAGAVPASAAPEAQDPQTFTVLAGGQSTPIQKKQPDELPAGAWQFQRFYPDKITIDVGDTIVWKINSAEPHQVDFPGGGTTFVPYSSIKPQPGGPPTVSVNPMAVLPQGGKTYDGSAFAGSGDISMTPPGVQEYRLTFTKAGTFNYFCSMHSAQLPNGQIVGMTASVTVQAAGSAYPRTQDQVAAESQSEIAADRQTALAADPQAKQVPPPKTRPDGTMLFHGNVGWDAGSLAYMRFAPEDFTIHVGDTIEWTQTSAETPHNVALLSGANEPDVALVQPQPQGPPTILLNPAVVIPAGGTTYAGTGYFNSGLMPGAKSGEQGPQTYTLTFTKPGTYEYTCVLHDEMGMNGFITVLATGTVAGMPRTGNADMWQIALLTLLVLGLALLSLGVVVRRRAAEAGR